jgi:transcriptional regulator with XRE-family HTH domain
LARQLPEGFPVRGTFAQKLDFLCRTVHPADRKPYTLEELGRAFDVSPQYVHALRRGTKTKPTLEVIQRIADFFYLPSGAFFNDRAEEAHRAAEDVQGSLALRVEGVHELALVAAGLAPDDRGILLALAEQMATRRTAHGTRR